MSEFPRSKQDLQLLKCVKTDYHFFIDLYHLFLHSNISILLCRLSLFFLESRLSSSIPSITTLQFNLRWLIFTPTVVKCCKLFINTDAAILAVERLYLQGYLFYA